TLVHKIAVSFLVAGAAVITLSGLANQDADAGRPREPGAADAGSSFQSPITKSPINRRSQIINRQRFTNHESPSRHCFRPSFG
ncbi:MAG TPA: hypothetical protein VH702_08690, partial [Vicinamibacterales bacterium]